MQNDDTRISGENEQAQSRRPVTSRRLTELEPEEVRALSPEERDEWFRQCREDNDDFHGLTLYIDALYPLSRRHFKADRDAVMHEDGEDGGDYQRRLTDARDALTDHLLSLPLYFEDDPGWLARMTDQHRLHVIRKEATAAGLPLPRHLPEGERAAEWSLTREEAAQYVAEYLPRTDTSLVDHASVTDWVTECLQESDTTPLRLAVCPRCHFVRRRGAPCDVCAMVPQMDGHLFELTEEGGYDKALAASEARLVDERLDYAAGLYEVWMRSATAATALCHAAMRQGVEALRGGGG